MKLIQLESNSSYGKEFYLFFLKFKEFAVFQGSLDVFDNRVSERWSPYLQISFSASAIVSVIFCIKCFGVSFELFSKPWNTDQFNLIDDDE